MAADREIPEISDDELLEVADNPTQARELRRALRTLADSDSVGDQLQRMARDVLAGRVGMREVVQSDTYLSAIGDRLGQIRRAAENLSPAEQKASEGRAEKLREETEAEYGPDEPEEWELDRYRR
ncbi:hypothetical protein [Kitasatospora sp. NPDC002040]|uniref:hypothetical protein n=1 Tax=Kitasatospora sp. NPDC002040 TaxID=3154661 RepID=UPI00332AB0F0